MDSCLTPAVSYSCYSAIKFDGSHRRCTMSGRKSLSGEVSIFHRSSIVSPLSLSHVHVFGDLSDNVINRNDHFSCSGEYVRARSRVRARAALEIKKETKKANDGRYPS